jgi:hypothetical protein
LFRDEKGNVAYVVYIPGLGGPSEKSTAVWLEKMTARDTNYFTDEPHIILDSLHGHFTKVMLGDWENVGATLHRLPAASGKWLNPCDQSINREMRREFTRLQQLDRRDKIRNIIRAYYSIKDETIIKSFNKCGVFDGDPDDIISAQACQGYRAKGSRDKQLQGYRVAFLDWASSKYPRRCRHATAECASECAGHKTRRRILERPRDLSNNSRLKEIATCTNCNFAAGFLSCCEEKNKK